MTDANLFPLSSSQSLRSAFIGKTLRQVPLPSAILDISKIKKNCKLMLDACSQLGLSFRAHVKTHKTSELTRLQVGDDCKDVRLIVSTVIEAESLVPLLQDYQSKGANVNVLYGIPLGPSKTSRLAKIADQLGPNSVSALIDNPAQLASVKEFKQQSGGKAMCVFVKADSGYHRAGLLPHSDVMIKLIKEIAEAEQQGDIHFLGFYSHNSLSYGGNHPDDAMDMLRTEIETCQQAASHLPNLKQRATPLVISVGASPTALSIQNILSNQTSSSDTSSATKTSDAATHLLSSLNLNSSTFTLEIHAGVYPVLDMQQVSANSRSFPDPLSAHQTQAMSVLTEVVSQYPDRTSQPEALVSAGTLALGREPCKSYPGWGVVTSWNLEGRYSEEDSVDVAKRMIVKRISQEHGVLGWESEERTDVLPVAAGDRIRLWINHACIAGAGFGWYLVVDSDRGGDEVVDVWVKWRGW